MYAYIKPCSKRFKKCIVPAVKFFNTYKFKYHYQGVTEWGNPYIKCTMVENDYLIMLDTPSKFKHYYNRCNAVFRYKRGRLVLHKSKNM